MNWRKKMKANGFELDSYSKKIQASANQLENLEIEKKELVQSLKNAPEDEMEEIGDEILKIEEAIEELDTNLCSNIDKYDKNRETYKVLGDKLKASREAKKSQQEPKYEPQPQPKYEEPQPKIEEHQATPKPQEEPKAKNGGGGWLIAGALLVVGSIIGVNLLRKK